jgi:hypothetical protein
LHIVRTSGCAILLIPFRAKYWTTRPPSELTSKRSLIWPQFLEFFAPHLCRQVSLLKSLRYTTSLSVRRGRKGRLAGRAAVNVKPNHDGQLKRVDSLERRCYKDANLTLEEILGRPSVSHQETRAKPQAPHTQHGDKIAAQDLMKKPQAIESKNAEIVDSAPRCQ